jgi:hypothetical protein
VRIAGGPVARTENATGIAMKDLLIIRFDTDHWVDAAPDNAVLEGFDYPRSGAGDV